MIASSEAEQYALSRNENARLAWMALTLSPEMGPTRTARAIAQLGSAERLFEVSLTELEAAGLPPRAAQFVFEGRAFKVAEDQSKHIADLGAKFLTPEDTAYPQRLRNIYDPPPVLWV